MKLNDKERLIIANQLLILEKLYPNESEYYAKRRKAVEQGYTLHYSQLTEHLYEEMTEEECKEVLDILNMYRAITFSYQKISDETDIDDSDIKFPGFSGNNEIKQLSYTHYFVVELDRFLELRDGNEYPDFNSHFPMIDRYRRMLQVWNAYDDKHHLTEEQIKKLLHV